MGRPTPQIPRATGRRLATLWVGLVTVAIPGASQERYLTAADVVGMPTPPADERISYGTDPLQFGELRLPDGAGPHPVALLIHGGCWLAQYDLDHIGGLAAAFTREGIATWTVEYRRVGNPGGGWPATFLDVARAADHLRAIARVHPLDLGRVIAVGHSAGGHLALWLAARPRLPDDSDLHSPTPLAIQGVLGLAPAPQLSQLHRDGVCGDVVDALMGGSPEEVPARYRDGSPAEMVPLRVPQVLIGGKHDAAWLAVGEAYYEVAKQAGDSIEFHVAPESGHFEMIVPTSTTWPMVRDAARSLLNMRQ